MLQKESKKRSFVAFLYRKCRDGGAVQRACLELPFSFFRKERKVQVAQKKETLYFTLARDSSSNPTPGVFFFRKEKKIAAR